ncbi:MAG: GTP cyclohydrolase I FolE [Planctomycetota bacterium]|nr:GTP cyclohydrolase I FolE [Planctomycetota bacterium]
MIAANRIPSLPLPSAYRHPGTQPVPDIDLHRIERAVREILLAIGEDPDRDGLAETPKRVARSYRELFRGLREDASTHLRRTFEQDHEEVIIVRDIEFASVCEHHLLPFLGRAHIAYLPKGGRVVGLSKLARTVDVFAHRPQVQERLTDQIANALVEHLNPQAVAVVIEAQHMCMKIRGVNKNSSTMQTFACRGSFKTDRAMGAEVISLMCQSRK